MTYFAKQTLFANMLSVCTYFENQNMRVALPQINSKHSNPFFTIQYNVE